jgi:hypothetical protein
MDLRDTPTQQLEAHIAWLRSRFGTADSPPAPQVWQELCREALEQALFAEAFLLTKIDDPSTHLPSLHIIRGTGAGADLVHPQERVVTYSQANGAEPEPEPEEAVR